jgi:hypothetical protein
MYGRGFLKMSSHAASGCICDVVTINIPEYSFTMSPWLLTVMTDIIHLSFLVCPDEWQCSRLAYAETLPISYFIIIFPLYSKLYNI